MANEILIEAERRQVVGKKVKQLRREGITPAVIYGGDEPVSIQLDTLKTFLTLRDAGANDIFIIDLDGAKHRVIARDVQRHLTRGDLLHVDFLEITKGSTLKLDASLVTTGQSALEFDGLGTTTQILFAVEIEARGDSIISEIEVDLSQIKTPEDVIFVGDLQVPDGVTILTADDIAVAKFDFKREEVEEETLEEGLFDSDAAGNVEVIGEADEEGDDEA